MQLEPGMDQGKETGDEVRESTETWIKEDLCLCLPDTRFIDKAETTDENVLVPLAHVNKWAFGFFKYCIKQT